MKNDDFLLLKWGTLKGYCFENSPEALETLKEYYSTGVSISVMVQHDTQKQKELLCKIIDEVNGEIENDWSGEILTKEEAKKYVMDYGKHVK